MGFLPCGTTVPSTTSVVAVPTRTSRLPNATWPGASVDSSAIVSGSILTRRSPSWVQAPGAGVQPRT